MEPILHLIPQPQSVKPRAGAFVLAASTVICLPSAADADDLFAARQLQDEIAAATGLRLRLERQARPYSPADTIVLLRAGRDAGLYPPEAFGWQPPAGRLPEQAYLLSVGAQGIVVAADSAAGVYYGVQTLRQIVRQSGPRLPQLDVVDAPALAERGVMLDVCRNKVPTLATLKELVDRLSLFKINQFQMHNEHAFFFPRHPDIGAGWGRLTNEEMLELDAWCRQRHVELVPNLQSFGHMQHILSLPAYRHLAETELCWSLAPTVEAGYQLLDDLYADLLPAFSSPQFNVNCDETFDLGQGRSAALLAEIGPGRLYLKHMLRVHDLAARYGRRMQMWGDIMLEHPEVIADLPADVTLLDWHYEGAAEYPSTEVFAGNGRRFLVCPGTSSWNTLFPRIENSNQNIKNLARDAVRHGAAGLLNTDWGDNGHYQPLGQSWYGYAYGAEQAWTGGRTPDEVFDAALGPLFFGRAQGDAVVRCIRRLGAALARPDLARMNATRTTTGLFYEPLVTGERLESLEPDTLRELGDAAQEAAVTFATAAASSREEIALREMAFSARLLGELAAKSALSQGISARWPQLAAGGVERASATAEVDGWLAAVDARWEAAVSLRAEFAGLWDAGARAEGKAEAMRYYRSLLGIYEVAAHWLRTQRYALANGDPLDPELKTYGGEAYRQAFERARQWARPSPWM